MTVRATKIQMLGNIFFYKKFRRTSQLVLAHLIQNDALKIKDELPELVGRLFDEEENIRGYAKQFFQELQNNHKNTIYNLQPGAISKLSRGEEGGGVSEKKFGEFAKAQLGYIDKDSMSNGLTEKLLHRLEAIPDKSKKEVELRNSKFFQLIYSNFVYRTSSKLSINCKQTIAKLRCYNKRLSRVPGSQR